MENTELVKLLATFSKEHRNLFMVFLNSPYCMEEQFSLSAIKLVEFVFASLDNGNHQIEEEEAYLYIYPEKTVDTGHDLSNLRSYTLRFFKKFIVWEQLKKDMDEREERLYLAKFYAENGFEAFAEKELKWLEEWQNEDRVSWTDRNYQTSLEVSKTKSYFLSVFGLVKEDSGLFSFLQELNDYYMHHRLKYTNILYGFGNLSKMVLKTLSRAMKIDFNEQQYNRYLNSDIGKLHHKAHQLIDPFFTPNHSLYQEFTELLEQLRPNLSVNDLANNESCARLYLIRNYNTGNIDVIRTLFELKKKMYRESSQAENLKFSSSLFVSTVKTALILGETEWAESFFKDCKNTLRKPDLDKRSAVNYCQGLLYFKRSLYEEAHTVLLEQNFSDLQLKCHAKVLEIQILYESKNEQIHSRLQATNMFFRRNPHLREEHQVAFLRFTNIVKRMLHPDVGYHEGRTRSLYKAIQKEKALAERFWLVQTIEQKLKKWN